ncbi:hypothetical protein L1D14_07505 [Vibrio tubiashii]|uniref:hypothetical protein n=1 Tax=Vibrio tubiashii TaxID=29498 RepID=UPI001EFE7401|nr:hypothetical protein [Vibrio tubiashii]MCG9576084.1 hypothetical protein [Vibrio tubiashii]
MPSELHEKQNTHAVRWLKKQGFKVIATNIRAAGSREIIDTIGYRSSCSILVESKVSRSDFLADSKKPERVGEAEGLGTYRFYICPIGLIKPEEVLPKGWGLLYSDGKRVVREFKPKGNLWPSIENESSIVGDWRAFQHRVNQKADRSILYSLCRRLVDNEEIIR